MRKLISQIAAATLGLWLARMFVPEVRILLLPTSNFFGFPITQSWEMYLLIGIILGLLNHFIKPALNLISLPLRVITLGFFGLVINGALIWVLTLIFKELHIALWLPLLYTTLIVWILEKIISKAFAKED